MPFVKNEWVDAYDGIAQVYSCNQFYTEEYSEDYRASFCIGEPLHAIVIYKLLCNFDGKFTRRSTYRHCGEGVCTKICEGSLDVLENFKRIFPEDYARYEEKQKLVPIQHVIKVVTSMDEELMEPVQACVLDLVEGLVSPFNFSVVDAALKSNFSGLKLFDRKKVRTKNNLTLYLHNDDYLVKEKRAVLTRVEAKIK